MKVKVEYVVEYETGDFYDEIYEYAGDHPVTLNMIKEFCIDRAIAVDNVDKKGRVTFSYIPSEYQVM
jgi:hypothetical protein